MPTAALIAHDGQKEAMREFAVRHASRLASFRLIATASTGRLIQEATSLQVEPYPHGPDGGDVMIAADVVSGKVELVFFLVEPRDVHPHDPDIQTLLRICNIYNVPLATNIASAELLLTAFLRESAR